MKVTLQQHGGIAAGITRRPQTLDGDRLPPDEARELEQLVAAAAESPQPEQPQPVRARDAMSYTITVEHSGAIRTLKGSDDRMSEAFTALLEWVEARLARSR